MGNEAALDRSGQGRGERGEAVAECRSTASRVSVSMSNSANESAEPKSESDASAGEGPGISDEQLPEDLQPTDDNPLAKPLDEESSGDSGIKPDTGDQPPAP